MPREKKKLILGIFIFALFFIFQKAEAAEINPVRSSHGVLNPAFAIHYKHSSPQQATGYSASNGIKILDLDDDTVKKGYTIVSSDSQFRLGLLPEAVDQKISASIQIPSGYPNFPQNTRAISAVYEFDLTNNAASPLNKPLNLSLKYQSDNHTPKHIYYFDPNKSRWLVIPSSVSFNLNLIQGTISLPHAKIVVLEQAAFRIALDQETLGRGFTVSNPDNPSFKLGIFPDTIDQETTVVLKSATLNSADLPEGLEVISDRYSFELKTKEPLQFPRPLVLSIKINQPDDHKKQVYYYDDNKKTWLPLPSQTVASDEVRAFIHLPFANLVVLKDSRYLEQGFASWYRSLRNPFGAASNDYPDDTILKVTNLANRQSVEVIIGSRGPFVPGRIIDLAHLAFQAIANLYQDGVILVKVEEV